MATAAPLEQMAPTPARREARRSGLYIWASGVALFIAIGGFFPTYWMQVPAGTFTGTPLMHLHAALFTAWPLLLLSQALLISRGGLRHHRMWGLAGISLASLMLMVGLMTAVVGMTDRLEAGYGDPARRFLIVPFTQISLFFAFFMAAIANINRSEWHKRLIVVATSTVLVAPMARFFFLYNNGMASGLRPGSLPPAPVTVSLMPIAVLDLLLVAAMAYDWRREGKVHPAWLWGLGILVPIQLLRDPIAHTQAWLAFAERLAHFT
ncbi:MAG TPA: hypothetical protein VM055_04900 [Novosphingobium sp.]|nr:hypothetical protein [Novosphingobium sp.]